METDEGVGPTSLEEPGEPAWTDPDFSPRAISSDGRLVVGLDGRTLEVRRVKTGEVKSVLDTEYRAGDPLLWMGGRMHQRIIVATRESGRTALLLCRTTGSCHRETGWLRGWVTLPFQTHFFGE